MTEHDERIKQRANELHQGMLHADTTGAGAEKRKLGNFTPEEKFALVMMEFEKGTLHSGSGDIVTDYKQALAIAYSESGLSRKKPKGKTPKQRILGKKV